MAGLSGKQGWFAGAKQTGKILGGAATVPASPSYKVPFTGGNIGPVRETDRLAETDSSRDQSAAYVTSSGVEGSPEFYVRDDSVGFFLAAVLGGVAAPVAGAAGATPFTHTITPSDTLAYHTFWRNIGGASGVTEQFTDCMVSSLTLSADAGAPLAATAGIQGLTPTFLTGAAATIGGTLPTQQPFNFNHAAVQLGGASTRLVSSFELTVENNVSRQQTDDVVPFDLAVGTREISLGFDLLFESNQAYRDFQYDAAGAVKSDIYTTSAKFTFSYGTGTAARELTFDLPSLAYEDFPVDPDPGGDPITVAVRAVAQKSGSTNLVTATVKNGVSTYV